MVIVIFFNNETNYIDGITIINTEGTILFTVKFNPDIDRRLEQSIVGKKLFDVFTNINKSNSTLFECMEKEKIIETRGQLVKNLYSKDVITDNISYPIKYGGIVVGAIELSKLVGDRRNNGEVSKNTTLINDSPIMNLKPKSVNLGYNATYFLSDIIYIDKKMQELVEYSEHIAKSNSPVFITGETGTGKELFAHGIHNASNRRGKPFIAQNCSAVPENLLESIFFGTSKGSFTGALNKVGLFEACNGGTLFLDELHSMPIYLQSKLLRVIESGAARRIGENIERKFDVRIIAATNNSNDEILKKKQIRHDLYYRLSVVKINIPPLRERVEDIKVLSDHFIKKYNKIFEKNITSISKEINNFIFTYKWPGNVRELENFIESAVLSALDEQSVIESKNIRNLPNYKHDRIHKTDVEEIKTEHEQITDNNDDINPEDYDLKKIVDEKETEVIRDALKIAKGNKTKAAKIMGIPRQTLRYKMNKLNIND